MATERWLERFDWMDAVGERWWPILGAVYFVVATKRVRGIKPMGKLWKPAKAIATAPVPLANRRPQLETTTTARRLSRRHEEDVS
jgi:hypothetical protein